MTRFISSCLCAAMAAAGATLCGASEIFPVVHHEPLTVRVLNGLDGKPQAGVRVMLAAGYTEHDLALGLWQEEITTNGAGDVRVPDVLANLPYLRVWVIKEHLCQADGRNGRFLVERIRNDGLSPANGCGRVAAAVVPGVLTLFIKVKVKVKGAAGSASPTTAPVGAASSAAASAIREEKIVAHDDIPEAIDPGTVESFAAYEQLFHLQR